MRASALTTIPIASGDGLSNQAKISSGLPPWLPLEIVASGGISTCQPAALKASTVYALHTGRSSRGTNKRVPLTCAVTAAGLATGATVLAFSCAAAHAVSGRVHAASNTKRANNFIFLVFFPPPTYKVLGIFYSSLLLLAKTLNRLKKSLVLCFWGCRNISSAVPCSAMTP